MLSLIRKGLAWRASLVALACLTAACGKKGPPLAPIVRIPAPVSMIHVQRVGSDVFITLTVPAKNIDGSMPIDISRIEIYGYTGRRPPPNARWVEVADLVATIPVIPPPSPLDAPDQSPPPDPSKGALTGMVVTVRDVLTAQKLAAGKVVEDLTRRPPPTVASVASTAAVPEVLQRFYMAIAFSKRGRPGPPGAAAQFALVDTPQPPAFVNARYSDTTLNLEWPPSGGIVGFLFDRALPAEEAPLNQSFEPVVPAPPTGATVEPAGPTKYNVYREVAPDPMVLPDEAAAVSWGGSPPTPINPAPLTTTSFADTVEFDRERCYTVRPVRGTAPNAVEGDPSPPNCFIPVDQFPPAPPNHLVAIADEGGISLIWEPNGEPDLTGYLILRGESGDATLQPLTSTPVAEARFRDTHVQAGKKYVYAVVAVDSRLPVANVSAESNRVEETAR